MKRLIAVALGLAALPTTAHAEWVNGNELYQWCSSQKYDDYYKCASYTLGVIDASQFDGKGLNVPSNSTRGQVVDVLKKYLQDHPESRNLPASWLVGVSVISAWPYLNQTEKKP